jgi:hypothetical protein
MVLWFELFFSDADSLHGEQRILRAAVAFFADARLLAPQVAVNGVALGHFVVAVALGEVHASAIGEFAQQAQYLPLDVSGRALGRIAEVDLVLDLQAAQLRVEYVQFLVRGHRSLHAQFNEACSRGEVPSGHGGEWYESKGRSVGGSSWLSALGPLAWINKGNNADSVGVNHWRNRGNEAEPRAEKQERFLFRVRRHLLDHGEHEFAVAVVQAGGVAADLAEEADFVVGELRQSLGTVAVAGLGEELR